ncbi:Zn-ribbon domain-containing OB-fold protein [Actinoplanes sp. NPDC000266]
MSLIEVAGTGIVDSFTVVHRADEPYILARVRLTEGPILLTHLDGVAEPRCDMPVQVAWRPLPDGRHLPVFRSADGL